MNGLDTRKPQWVRWKYGWGETMEVAKGITLTVGKGDMRGDKFFYEYLGIRSKPVLETMEVAKSRVIQRALAVLTEATAKLSDL